jgi:hypothetical protein
MNKKLQTAAAGVLMLSLTLGLVDAASAETTNQTDQAQPKQTIQLSVPAVAAKGGVFMAYPGGLGMLLNPIHERNYLKLMVKSYTPGSEQAWNRALEDRKMAEQLMDKSLTLRMKAALPGEQQSEEANIITDKLQAGEQQEVDIQKGDKKFTIFVNKKEAATTGEQNTPLVIPLPGDIMKTSDTDMEVSPQAKLQGDFSKAVEAGDETVIKELLPKLLDEYKQTTEKINKEAEKLKQAQADAPSK